MRPISVAETLQPPAPEAAAGVQLANALLGYDRQAGYPMAWYFNMLTGRRVPDAVAAEVLAEWEQGYRYLPERDMACVADFGKRPYRV